MKLVNNKVKIIIWIFITLALIISFISIIGFLGKFNYENKKIENQITVNEAKQIAEKRIKQSYNYNDLNGYNLKLKSDPIICGTGCFELVYEYKVNKTNITNLEKIETSMIIEGGSINNVTYSEITKADKRIVPVTDFNSCVEAGYEVLYPDCIGCKPYCETPEGDLFSETLDSAIPSNICEDKCGDGICDEMVCQGEGCPCPETKESCQEDCI